MRFLAQVSFSPSFSPLIFLSKTVPKICLSKNFVIVALLTHQSYNISSFSFHFIRFFLSMQFYYLLPMYLHAETFSSPRTLIWSQTSLFFESPVRLKNRWKYKSLWVTSIMSFQPFRILLCILINSRWYEFWKLQFSRIPLRLGKTFELKNSNESLEIETQPIVPPPSLLWGK